MAVFLPPVRARTIARRDRGVRLCRKRGQALPVLIFARREENGP